MSSITFSVNFNHPEDKRLDQDFSHKADFDVISFDDVEHSITLAVLKRLCDDVPEGIEEVLLFAGVDPEDVLEELEPQYTAHGMDFAPEAGWFTLLCSFLDDGDMKAIAGTEAFKESEFLERVFCFIGEWTTSEAVEYDEFPDLGKNPSLNDMEEASLAMDAVEKHFSSKADVHEVVEALMREFNVNIEDLAKKIKDGCFEIHESEKAFGESVVESEVKLPLYIKNHVDFEGIAGDILCDLSYAEIDGLGLVVFRD